MAVLFATCTANPIFRNVTKLLALLIPLPYSFDDRPAERKFPGKDACMPTKAFAALSALLALLFTSTLAFSAEHFVYTATNSAAGNEIVAYHQNNDGTIQLWGVYPTNGLGSGGTVAPIQSQNSILLDPRGQFLFVVNIGSGTISSFNTTTSQGLKFRSQVFSGGVAPASLTIHGNLLYVLNVGDNSISGFYIGTDGELTPVANSTLTSSDYSNAKYGNSIPSSTLQFDPTGKYLYVSNIGTLVPFTGFALSTTGVPIELNSATLNQFVNLQNNAPGSNSFPLDLAASTDGQYLYVLDAALGGIRVFRIGANASLSYIGSGTVGLRPRNGEAGLAVK